MTTLSTKDDDDEVTLHCHDCGMIASSSEEARADGFCHVKVFDARRRVVGGGDDDDQQEEETAFLPYENPTWGIFMQYPSDWTASTSGLRDYTELIAFHSPLQNLSQPFAARLAISAVQFVQNVSLPEYTDFVLTGLQNQTGLEVKNSSEVTIAGYPGYRVVLAEQPFQNGTSLIYSMNIWTTVGCWYDSSLFLAFSTNFEDISLCQ
jgi:hypothetical protein